MKILITGRNGQVGWELQRALTATAEIIALDAQEMNLADADAIRRTLRDLRPDCIINPAAYTAVDKAESDANLAQAVNGIAPGILAEEAKNLNAVLVHYSTDYVYNGHKTTPYAEYDIPDPQSVYGRTKLAGDCAVLASGCRHLILRTSWVYGVHGANFVKTMLRLARERERLSIVADQFGAPTWARDLAQATTRALEEWKKRDWDAGSGGLYHLTAGGRTCWYEYALEIVRLARQYDAGLAQKSIAIQPIATSEYPLPAKRPVNSTLSNEKIRNAFGIELPAWQDSLAECVRLLYEPAASAKPD